MNYVGIYEKLIDRARARILDGYKERHHIVPRCVGGTNTKDNMVDLTAEEHFIAHLLIAKIHPENLGLVLAAAKMAGGQRTNKSYGWLRRRLADALKGNKHSLGVFPSAETREKISKANKGRKKSPETRARMAEGQKARNLRTKVLANSQSNFLDLTAS